MNFQKTDTLEDSDCELKDRLQQLQTELVRKNHTIEELRLQINVLKSANQKLEYDKEVTNQVIDYIIEGAQTIVLALPRGIQ
jgi:chromosome segregation ATPase